MDSAATQRRLWVQAVVALPINTNAYEDEDDVATATQEAIREVGGDLVRIERWAFDD